MMRVVNVLLLTNPWFADSALHSQRKAVMPWDYVIPVAITVVVALALILLVRGGLRT
jgi:hypothetical protein